MTVPLNTSGTWGWANGSTKQWVPPQTFNTSWQSIRSTQVKTYMCPADAYNQNPFTGTMGLLSAAGKGTDPSGTVMGSFDDQSNSTDLSQGWARGNYGVICGFEAWSQQVGGFQFMSGAVKAYRMWTGCTMAVNYGCKLSDITDGTSNTMILSELRAGISQYDARGTWAMGFSGMSAISSGLDFTDPTPNNLLDPAGLNGDKCGMVPLFGYPNMAADGMGCITKFAGKNTDYTTPGWAFATPWSNSWGGSMARSMHGGKVGVGVNSCFADGSTHFIPNSVSVVTWEMLCSRDDGYTLGSDWIEE
jgi:hypothetical protein